MTNLQNINLLTEQNKAIFANRKDQALKEALDALLKIAL
jgi:hypothetical protein